MDEEVTMIRDLLARPVDPPARVVSGAWESLEQQMLSAAPAAGASGSARRPRRRLLSRRWLLGGVAAGAAAALAAGVLVAARPRLARPRLARPASTTWNGHIATEDRPLGGAQGSPGRAALLSLAVRVAHAPAGSGRYWCNIAVNAGISPIGPNATELVPPRQGTPASPVSDYRYTIASRSRLEVCYNRSGNNIRASSQDLGAWPATPADVAAWRKAGAPGHWLAWYGHHQPIYPKPGPVQVSPGKRGGNDRARVPASAAKLKALMIAQNRVPSMHLSKAVRRRMRARVGSSPKAGRPLSSAARHQMLISGIFGEARNLLLSPLTPAQRAADYQVLASIPGIHSKPDVKDPSGRVGTALWLGSPTWVVIVDPVTGQLLADEYLTSPNHSWVYAPGTVTQYYLWTNRWTNHLP